MTEHKGKEMMDEADYIIIDLLEDKQTMTITEKPTWKDIQAIRYLDKRGLLIHTDKQYVFKVRYPFRDFLAKNLIYCEDAHSFVHVLYDIFKEHQPKDYREAQNLSFLALTEMHRAWENIYGGKEDDKKG